MAALNAPTGLAFDTLGNLYIADTGNNRIRMFTPQGYLYTVAGDGRKGYNGNGMRPVASSLKIPQGWPSARRGNCIFRTRATTSSARLTAKAVFW